jgi:hypothetical protein
MKYIHLFKTFNEFVSDVNEGLIKTSDLSYVVDNLKFWMRDLKFAFKIENIKYDKKSFSFKIENFNYIFNIRDILEILENFTVNINGYFPSSVDVKFFHGEKNIKWYDDMWDFLVKSSNDILEISINFESKFDDVYVPETNIVYHITNNSYIDKIGKNGLVPKSKNKISTHPDRIYFSYSIKSVEHLFKKMRFILWEEKFNNSKNLKSEKFSILEINIKDLKIIFRKDPNYIDGFYTTTNISPNRIKVIKELE